MKEKRETKETTFLFSFPFFPAFFPLWRRIIRSRKPITINVRLCLKNSTQREMEGGFQHETEPAEGGDWRKREKIEKNKRKHIKGELNSYGSTFFRLFSCTTLLGRTIFRLNGYRLYPLNAKLPSYLRCSALLLCKCPSSCTFL